MYKQRLKRGPLIAVLGFLAVLIAPAAAQAHHISLVASCDASSNVTWRVDFIQFSGPAKPTTKGTVKLDNAVVKQVPPSTIAWNTEPGTLSGSNAAAGGQTHVVKADFMWKVNGTWETGTATKTTNQCPTPPKNPAISIVKDGPSTRYVGDQATFTYTVTNTGDVVLTNPDVSDDKCTPVSKVPDGQSQFDPGDVWHYTCTTTITSQMGDELVNVGTACAWYDKPTGSDVKVCDEDDHKTTIPKPGILLTKTGANFAYAGDTVSYFFAVTNTGNVTLALGDIADDKCTSTPVRKAGETDTSFDKGDTFNFSCTYVVPAGVGSVLNTAEVCGRYTPPEGSGIMPKDVCSTDTHEFPVRNIAIQIDKAAVETTAVAGTTVHFTIAVTNPAGSTPYVNYVFDDANCDEVRTGANAEDTTLDPGETWTYGCAMPTAVGQTSADNSATATGTNSDGRSASATDAAAIPLTQPTSNPPTVTPEGTPPGGQVLPETIASGTARLRGPSGCVKQAFRAKVSGRSIASVAFYVDGRLVKVFNGKRSVYSIKVKPGRYGFGRHRVVARVRFVAESGTKARRLPLTFRRCAQGAVAPRFTG
jgi:hypothetical protein